MYCLFLVGAAEEKIVVSRPWHLKHDATSLALSVLRLRRDSLAVAVEVRLILVLVIRAGHLARDRAVIAGTRLSVEEVPCALPVGRVIAKVVARKLCALRDALRVQHRHQRRERLAQKTEHLLRFPMRSPC